MPSFLFLCGLSLCSLLLAGATVWRLYKYINRYRFSESVYTLLFGFMRLRYFVWIYVVTTLFMGVVTFLYAFAFLLR